MVKLPGGTVSGMVQATTLDPEPPPVPMPAAAASERGMILRQDAGARVPPPAVRHVPTNRNGRRGRDGAAGTAEAVAAGAAEAVAAGAAEAVAAGAAEAVAAACATTGRGTRRSAVEGIVEWLEVTA